jgi:hypothetical protein
MAFISDEDIGEFTHSRLIRANTFSSESGPVENEKIQSYSGRRINTSIEVPWIINPRPPNLEAKCLGFDERWNKINQLLLAEADEWGYYGQFRSPMGEYLEELSKRAVPNLKESERLRGSRAGVIDVCICTFPLDWCESNRTLGGHHFRKIC